MKKKARLSLSVVCVYACVRAAARVRVSVCFFLFVFASIINIGLCVLRVLIINVRNEHATTPNVFTSVRNGGERCIAVRYLAALVKLHH